MEKTCISCLIKKPLSEFYAHKKMSDGKLGACKECVKDRAKKRWKAIRQDPFLLNEERARHREKYYRLNYKEKHIPTFEQKKAATNRWASKYPEKIKAHTSASNMTPKTHGNHLHHWSYNEQHFKDVIELSPTAHYTAHRFMVYDQERKMYRKLDGVLLDSKDAHKEYIDVIIERENR